MDFGEAIVGKRVRCEVEYARRGPQGGMLFSRIEFTGVASHVRRGLGRGLQISVRPDVPMATGLVTHRCRQCGAPEVMWLLENRVLEVLSS